MTCCIFIAVVRIYLSWTPDLNTARMGLGKHRRDALPRTTETMGVDLW